MKGKKLYRDTDNQMLSGVCSGLGDYFDIDTTLIRLIVAMIAVFTTGFPVLMIYIVCAIIIPRKKDIEKDLVPEAEYEEKEEKKSSKSGSIFDE